MGLRGPAGLPVKPRNDRDWADNVYREGLVAYDIGLWVGALDALAALGERLDPQLGAAARAEAAAARGAADAALWRGDRYADYVRPDGWAEAHLALDALMLLRVRRGPRGAGAGRAGRGPQPSGEPPQQRAALRRLRHAVRLPAVRRPRGAAGQVRRTRTATTTAASGRGSTRSTPPSACAAACRAGATR